MTLCFSSALRALCVGYFIFAIQDLQNSVLWSLLLALCSGLQNTYLHSKDDNFNPVNIEILFQHKNC